MSDNNEVMFTTETTAHMFGVSVGTIRNWIKAGTLNVDHVDNDVLISATSIKELIDVRQIELTRIKARYLSCLHERITDPLPGV